MREQLVVYPQPDDAPKHPRSKVWRESDGPALYIETYIRGRWRMWQIDSMAYTGVVVYMVVDGPINPATAMYRTSLEDPTQYTLKQLLDMHGICAPQLSFYLPSNRGLKPPFYKIHQVDWAKYKLELAAGAKAALKGIEDEEQADEAPPPQQQQQQQQQPLPPPQEQAPAGRKRSAPGPAGVPAAHAKRGGAAAGSAPPATAAAAADKTRHEHQQAPQRQQVQAAAPRGDGSPPGGADSAMARGRDLAAGVPLPAGRAVALRPPVSQQRPLAAGSKAPAAAAAVRARMVSGDVSPPERRLPSAPSVAPPLGVPAVTDMGRGPAAASKATAAAVGAAAAGRRPPLPPQQRQEGSAAREHAIKDSLSHPHSRAAAGDPGKALVTGAAAAVGVRSSGVPAAGLRRSARGQAAHAAAEPASGDKAASPGTAGAVQQQQQAPKPPAPLPPPPQQQQQQQEERTRQPWCSVYEVAFAGDPKETPPVPYTHVLRQLQQPASAGSSAAAGANQQQRMGLVVLGQGASAIVYLLQQQGPVNTAYPAQVAFKVPYLECKEASHHEQHVLGHMRRDLCNVVQLLGIGRGSSAGEVVQGLVFEYCPGGDLAEWAVKLLQQAAQEPTMQQTHPLMAAAAASLSGTSWRPPKEWEVQMSAMDEHEQLPFIAAYLRPLREQVLEAPLKQHMRQLLRLVVKLSGSSSDSSTSSGAGGNGHSGRSGDDGGGSGSSSRGGDGSSTGGWGRGSGSRYPVTTTSATVPAGGLVINFDIKPSNIFLTADGTPKLGDWNVAMYVPDATLHQPFAPKGFTQRYCAPEVYIVREDAPASGSQQQLSQVPAGPCLDGGRVDTWGLLATWLHVLTNLEPFWWMGVAEADRSSRLGRFLVSCWDKPEVMPFALDKYYAPQLSPAALAFFKHALVANWRARPTPAQLLEHPYMCG